MSSIYNLEPQPTASVILKTTLGDLSVELFAKQTPLTSRNFLQLCLDGYYDNTIFHRLVPGFIIQGGDPTGTGNGGESIYDGGAYGATDFDPWPMDQRRGANAGPQGIGFKDEFHSRLKFNRRGLLGMANESKIDSNGSQFFFTLEKAEELNGRNTVFGRIVGDTIYNLARMGESEVAEGSERPLYPIRITSVEILVNPFEDMKKSDRAVRTADTSAPSGKPAQQKKGKKGKAAGKMLLSFGDDEGEGEEMPVFKKTKFDSRVVAPAEADEEESQSARPKKSKDTSIKEREPTRDVAPQRSHPRQMAGEDDDTTVKKTATTSKTKPSRPTYNEEDSLSPEPEVKKKTALDSVNEEIAALKASMKRDTQTDTAKETKKTPLEKMIPETSTRGRKRRRGGEGVMPDSDLAIFEVFRSRLGQAHAAAGDAGVADISDVAQPSVDASLSKNEDGKDVEGNTVADDDEAALCDLHFIANCQSCKSWDRDGAEVSDDDDNDPGWLSHKLTFAADKLGKDLTYRKKAEDELVVIDPRERARTLKEEQRAKRSAQAGESSREWDQARNAKLARQSALADRAAR